MKILKKYKYYILICITTILTISALLYEGHTFLSQSGKIYLWMGDLSGSEVSQHLSDWYSPSHFIHGIIFFFLLSYIFGKFKTPPNLPYKQGRNSVMLLLAIIIESAWEILENSPIIINRYREGALAAGYFGDSILNSLSDLSFMTLGFFFAKKFGWKISFIVLIILELVTLYFIRDNLALNIIMLLHPFESISNWQIGS